jgi:hypothetical protein
VPAPRPGAHDPSSHLPSFEVGGIRRGLGQPSRVERPPGVGVDQHHVGVRTWGDASLGRQVEYLRGTRGGEADQVGQADAVGGHRGQQQRQSGLQPRQAGR